ncbi:MAG: endolytic transglycosylase MltG [Acidobacteriota bacterium]
MRRRTLARVAAVVLMVAGAAIGYGVYALSAPYKGFSEDRMLVIPRGSSTRAIAHQLHDAGVIQSEWVFLAERALMRSANLQAGQYQFTKAASVADVFDRIRRGDVYTFEFTVPEGSNIWDIARLLEVEGIMKEEDFLHAARDPTPIRDLDPDAETLEGYLFPSTYRLSTITTPAELCKMMVAQFRKEWLKLIGPPPADKSSDKPEEINRAPIRKTVTLASLVEKETGAPEERGLVAGVFTNRLKTGMNLACDPTVIYAALLIGKYRGKIYQSDLDRESPYNTYHSPGLPPGPIANPGAATLKAALHPTETAYLYFVAKPEGGGHVFSENGAAHAKAVQNYRSAMQADAKANTGKAR